MLALLSGVAVPLGGAQAQITVASGTQTLSSASANTGPVTINTGATLALSGFGSVSGASVVTSNGTFDISAATSGSYITSLAGTGTVSLGAQRLRLNNAGDTFSGVIADGGLSGGTGGGLSLEGGSETLTGKSTYTGSTYVASGTTLFLSGTGSIGNSAYVSGGGTFDISGTAGTAIKALYSVDSSGTVNLGTATLTLTGTTTIVAGTTTVGNIYAGTINGTGGIVQAGGTQILSGSNGYTGTTTINPGATLALSGTFGSIGSSPVVTANGTFDISGTTSGAYITSLAGSGTVSVGAQRLRLSGAADTFSGVIANGGLSGGTGGGVSLESGSETFSGINTYTGSTYIGSGTTLFLTGNGSVSKSGYVSGGGTLDISGTSGTSIKGLYSVDSSGVVNLGAATLTLTGTTTMVSGTTSAGNQYAGVINGTGSLVQSGGSQTLSGVNGYTGTTTINSGATLALSGSGSITQSAGVIANGTFDISGTGGSYITALTGSGSVSLGAQRLRLSNASGTFSGVIADGGITGGTGGGLSLEGGSQTLSGKNTYTGSTYVASGTTLSLSGTGSIAQSSYVSVDGLFDISQTTSGASVRGLYATNSTGLVNLGAQTLTLTGATAKVSGTSNAGNTYAGVIEGTGSLVLAGGTQTLTGTDTYSGGTTVGTGTTSSVPTLAISSAAALGTGGVTLNDGTLAAASGAVTVSQTVQLLGTANGLSTGSASNALTVSSVISGSGGLTASGGGTVTLTNSDTYTGATTIAAGSTLALSGSGAITRSSMVTDSGTFSLAGTPAGATITSLAGSGGVTLGGQTLTLSNAAGSFAGAIGGTGALAITTGTETLTGTSTYSGGTTVGTGGTPGAAVVAIGSGGAIGTGKLTLNNGTVTAAASAVTVSQPVALLGTGSVISSGTASNAITVPGLVSGTGALTASGGGSVYLSGTANTYSGGTTVVQSTTLKVAADGSLGLSSAPLTVQSGSEVLAEGNLVSARPITLYPNAQINSNGFVLDLSSAQVTLVSATGGSPVLMFSASQGGVSGPHVSGGTVVINNDALTVGSGSTLAGVGTVTANQVTIGGNLTPGNSPGTLTFPEPLTLTSAATYTVNIDGTGTGTGAGNYSRVLVTGAGNTFTAAGVLAPILRGITGSATNTYTPPLATSFDVVNATGGVLGSFASLTQPSSGLPAGARFDALYTANDITLWVTPASYQNLTPFGVALSSNQTQTAIGLDAYRGTAGVRTDPATTAILGTLFAQQPAALPQVFNSLAGTIYGDALMESVQRDRAFGDTIAARQAAVREGVGASSMSLANGGPGVTVWLSATGQNTAVGSNGNTGYNASAGGFAVGADKGINPNLTLGLAVGTSFGTVTSNNTGGKDDLTTTFVSGYGSYRLGAAFVDAQLGMNFGENAVRRSMPVFGSQAMANPNGTGADFSLEAGRVFQVGGFQLTPMAGLRVDQASRGSLTESGAGAFSLAVNSGDAVGVQGKIGGRASTSFDIGQGYAMSISGRLFYAHEFGDDGVNTTAAFTSGASAVPMSFRTARAGRDGALAGLGIDIRTPSKAVTFYVDYGADVRSNATSQAGSIGVRITW